MRVAQTLDEVEEKKLDFSIISDPYINAFAQKMMELSNDLNENEWIDADDIKEEYLPAIREFIWNITGL